MELGSYFTTQSELASARPFRRRGAAFALVLFFGWYLLAIVFIFSILSLASRLCGVNLGGPFSHTTLNPYFVFLYVVVQNCDKTMPGACQTG